jgi:hypothetical protein
MSRALNDAGPTDRIPERVRPDRTTLDADISNQ